MKFSTIQFQSPSLSLEPPNLNLPSPGDINNKNYEDSALPSIKQEQSTAHMLATEDVATHDEHKVERYPVTTIDFSRVETPFIIGVWILFASIAKIGECIIIITQRHCTISRYLRALKFKITSILSSTICDSQNNTAQN